MRLSRRRLLAGGVVTGGLIPLAGCLAADGEAGTPTATSTPRDFGIDAFAFCRERPDGYDDYEPMTDPIYAPTETVWLYVEPVGVSVGEGSDGAGSVALEQTVRVVGPHDSVLVSRDWTRETDISDASDRSTLHLARSIRLPQPPHAGEHRLTTTITDRHSGDSVTREETFSVAGEIAVEHRGVPFDVTAMTVCPGDRAAEEACVDGSTTSVSPGTTVRFVATLGGLHYQRTNTGVEVRLDGRLEVLDPDGRTFVETSVDESTRLDGPDAVESYVLSVPVEIGSEATRGAYLATLGLTDAYGASAEATTSFAVG